MRFCLTSTLPIKPNLVFFEVWSIDITKNIFFDRIPTEHCTILKSFKIGRSIFQAMRNSHVNPA